MSGRLIGFSSQKMMSNCRYANTYGVAIKCLVTEGVLDIDGFKFPAGTYYIPNGAGFCWEIAGEGYRNICAEFSKPIFAGSAAGGGEVMSEVKREHLAGLKFFAKIHGNDLDSMLCEDLDKLIAQASAAPEQEPVAWVPCSPEWLKAGGDCETAPRICCAPGQGISHLHPSHDIARLRADLGEAKGEYDRSTNKVAELRDQLKAYTQRADAAERKLGEAVGLLSDLMTRPDLPPVARGWIEAFLPASAEPAEPNTITCDRAHGGGQCQDPECWNDVEPAKGGDGEVV